MNYYQHIDRSRDAVRLPLDEDSEVLVPREEIGSGGQPGSWFLLTSAPLTWGARLFWTRSGWTIVHSHVNALGLPVARPPGGERPCASPTAFDGRQGRARQERAQARLLPAAHPGVNCYPTHRLACSHLAGEWLFGKEGRAKVVPNAIDMNAFAFDERWRSKALAKHVEHRGWC